MEQAGSTPLAGDSDTLRALPKPIEILLVEDDPGDARLAELALKKAKVTNSLHHVQDGVEALGYLHREGPYANSPRPDLVLLDLRLPRKDGHEVLAEVKADEALKDIPVVVLTSSSEDKDLLSAYGLEAESYLSKPFDFAQLLYVIGLVDKFWVTIVELQSTDRPETKLKE